MRPRKLAPMLTAAAVVLGASSAVFAAEGGPALFTLAAEDGSDAEGGVPEEEAPEDEAPGEEVPGEEAPEEEAPEEEAPEDEAPEQEVSGEEAPEAEGLADEEPELEAQAAADDADDASAFSAWVENYPFEDEGCHRGQTIAGVARHGPENFDGETFDCVGLEDRPGNRGAEDDDRGRPPAHAGNPGPPPHAGVHGDRPPAHAGNPGPPPHANRGEDAGPPPRARSQQNRDADEQEPAVERAPDEPMSGEDD